MFNRSRPYLKPHDPDRVTSRNPAEAEPAAGDLSRDQVEAIWQSVVDCYRSGIHPGMALCVRRRGQVVLDRAIGHLKGNGPNELPHAQRIPIAHDTPFDLFSASKAITAMVVHLLDERREVHLDDPVCEYIPEFAKHGKRWITLRHVLTHRAGLPTIPGEHIDLDLLSNWDQIVEILCDATPTAPPGRRLEYHALTGGFILGEVVQRTTGRDIRTYLEQEILQPLGFERMTYGVAPDEVPLVAKNARTGHRPPFPISAIVQRALGVGLEDAVDFSNDPRYLTGLIPAGNIVASANEASRFYQLLLNQGELDGTRVFDPRTVRRAVGETSYLELDLTLAMPIRYGVGFMLGADYLSFFGPGTPRAFGHLGFLHVVTWADPERDIAVALMNTGKPLITPRMVRWIKILSTISRVVPRDGRRWEPSGA